MSLYGRVVEESGVIENEEDDEFFGNQDDDVGAVVDIDSGIVNNASSTTSTLVNNNDNSNNNNGFGTMGQRELAARQNELKTVAYLDAYDEAKEVRLQEGFEIGYRQTFSSAYQLGMNFGKVSTTTKTTKAAKSLHHQNDDDDKATKTASRHIRNFLKKFEDTLKDEDDDKTLETEFQLVEDKIRRQVLQE